MRTTVNTPATRIKFILAENEWGRGRICCKTEDLEKIVYGYTTKIK